VRGAPGVYNHAKHMPAKTAAMEAWAYLIQTAALLD
jgi:hypothetical protein